LVGLLPRALLLASVSATLLLPAPALRADPNAFIGLGFGLVDQMIRNDMQLRQQRRQAEAQRRAEAVVIRRLQAALQRLGYYRGRIDGDFGSGTQEALGAYQRDRGIYPTSSVSEYDISQIEADARSSPPPQPPPRDSSPLPGTGKSMQEVEYTSITPQAEWLDLRFSQAQLSQPGPYKPPSGGGWLVVASGATFQWVAEEAIAYAQDFPGTAIIKSGNGRFAITVGWLPDKQGKRLLELLKSNGIIPSDAFVGSGSRYIGPVWTTSRSLKSRNDLMRHGFFRASPHAWDRVLDAASGSPIVEYRARVAGVSGAGASDGYLSLRKTSNVSGDEITRMPEGTLLRLLDSKDGWSRVALLDGREGWASAKYIALNDNVKNGTTAAAQQPPAVENPYGDRDLQDRLLSDGKILLQDIGLFLKTNPDVQGITSIAEIVSRLNAAISSRDFQNIEAATASLRQLLSQNSGYKLFAERREEQRREEEQRQKAEAIRLADRNIYFLKQYIAQNVTTANIGTLAGLLKEYETARRFPTLAGLDGLNRRLETAISRDNLTGAYQQILQGYVAPIEKPELAKPTPGHPSPQAQPVPLDGGEQAQRELRNISDEAQLLLDQLSRFGAAGQKVSDVPQAARLSVNLRASLRAADAAAILRDRKALEDLLARDTAFTDFQRRENEARRLEEARKLEAATREARRIDAFVDDYISRNFGSDKVEMLISVQDDIRASLRGGDAPAMSPSVDNARDRIAKAGLKLELDAFKLSDPSDESPAVVKCRSAGNLGQWQEARALCTAALAEKPGDAALEALLRRARDMIAAQEKAEEEDRRREAELETSRTSATDLLTRVTSFASDGGQLSEPMRIARLAEALKGVIGGKDASRITAARDGLSSALAEDRGFSGYLRNLEKGEQDLGIEVLVAEDAEGRRIRAFIAAYVSRNVTASGIGALLAADDELARALESRDGAQLLKANGAARQAVAQLGASAELDAYQLPASHGEDTTTCLDLVTKSAWEEALDTCRGAVDRNPQDSAAAAALERVEAELAQRNLRDNERSLEKERRAAADLLISLDAFAKDGGTFKDPLGVARLVAGLRTNLTESDPAALRRSVTSLDGALQSEAAFIAFARQYEESQQRAALDTVAEARAESRRIKAFIKDHVRKNVASPDVPKLLEIVTLLESGIASNTLDNIAGTNAAAVTDLSVLKLDTALKAFSLAPRDVAVVPTETPNELFIDGKNRQLLEGDGEDIMFLFNNSGTAGGVRRDLLGRLVFPGVTNLCWYHDVPQHDLGTRLAMSGLSSIGARDITLTGVCRAEGLESAHVVALRRSSFLTTDRAYAKSLVDAFSSGKFEVVREVSGTSIRQKKTDDETLVAEIRDEVTRAQRKGFGFLMFKQDVSTLCMVPGPMTDAVMELLAPELHLLSGQLPGWTTRDVQNPDLGFAEARSGNCGALLLEAPAMAQVLAAAEREQTDLTILAVWLDEQDVSETQARLKSEEASRAEAEQVRLRRIEDEATQDRLRRERLGEEKARREAELRDRYGSAAYGFAADTGDQVAVFIEAPDAAETASVASLFPSLASWYRNQITAGWELQSDGYTSDLVDYGTVRWQGRALDTVFVKMAVGMKHRELGKYEETCLLVGVVVDQEFSRYRDVFEARCLEAEPGLNAWKASHGFESRWIID
jgi:hypothetical protein